VLYSADAKGGLTLLRKGELTRHAILERSAAIASRMGLSGVTIGQLAEDLELSKSGLFAHFQSKQALQLQTLQFAGQLFIDRVIRPALKAHRGEPRMRALFERWLEWAQASTLEGGCLFVAAASELDDREGPVRDELVRQQKAWLELIANVARGGATEGDFHAGMDAEQFAYDLHGVMLAYHHARRLLRDKNAGQRARRAFLALLRVARATPLSRAARKARAS